jgi:NAD(P)-dependent dehydrogenase (short-subunit alcohol dehydrogenase family)
MANPADKADKTAVVTGAGSGVGRAVALRLASQGWSVALVGRQAAGLGETRSLAGPSAERMLVAPCDVADARAVEAMAAEVLRKFGGVSALINSAGTNTPQRGLGVLGVEKFRQVVEVNLNGTFYCVHAFLPDMRRRGRGTIVNIVSDAGLIANAKAGAAYVAGKFGVTGLTQSINAEERGNGIRACAIFPGDINTPLLDKRPAPPPPEAREKMLQPEDVADCVLLALNLPDRAVVEQLVIRPR